MKKSTGKAPRIKKVRSSSPRFKALRPPALSDELWGILDSAPDAIVTVDERGRIVLVNTQAEKMFGYTREELLGKPVELLLPVPTRAQHVKHRLGYHAKPYTRPMGAGLDLAGLRRDGTEFPVEISLSAMQTPNGLLVTSAIRDISERKQAERALRESEERFHTLAKISPVGIFQTDQAGRCTYVNQEWCEITGLTPQKALGRDWFRALHPEDRDRIVSEWRNSARENRPFQAEYRIERRDGRITWVQGQAAAQQGAPGEIVGHVGTVTDITKRRQAEEKVRLLNQELERRVVERTSELQDERDRAQRYLDVAGVIIAVIDRDQKVALVNKKGCEVLGYAEGEMLGRNWFDCFLPERMRSQVKSVFEKVVSGDLEPYEYYENSILTRSGEERIVAWHNTVLRNEHGEIYATLSSGADITDKAELERQLIQSERLVALGEMAASLAHELNNPLAIILGFAQDLLTEIEPGDPRRQSLKIIEEETRRCKGIMRDLLEFGRPLAARFSQVDLKELIGKGMDLASGKLQKAAVKTVLQLDKNVPPIWADAQQIQQVLLNLLFNAMEAMPEGGTLSIRAWAETETSVHPHDGESPSIKGHVKIAVADTGHGIDDADLGKIFRPFFSKKKKKGIGLGLSVCETIIKAHSGKISVESRPGCGSTFCIVLPIDRRSADRFSRAHPAEPSDRQQISGDSQHR